MKKLIFFFIAVLLCTQAFALDKETVNIKVKVEHPPVIEKFIPTDGHKITEGDSLQITVTADDPNNDILNYQYYINEEIKQDWTTDSSFNYLLTEADRGLNTIKAKVTDGATEIVTDTIEIYVFRKTPNLPR